MSGGLVRTEEVVCLPIQLQPCLEHIHTPAQCHRWFSGVPSPPVCLNTTQHKTTAFPDHAALPKTPNLNRPELQRTTPVPRDEFVDFNDVEAQWAQHQQLHAARGLLEAASKDCMVQAKK